MKASDIKKILWLISFISHKNKNVDETDKLLKISFCQNLLKNKQKLPPPQNLRNIKEYKLII